MAVWVNERCHKCRHSFTDGYTPIREVIGQPFMICPRCNSINERGSNCTEWLLMSRSRRIRHYISAGLNVVVLSAFLAMLIALAWLYVETGTIDFKTDADVEQRYLLGLLAGVPLSIWRVVHVHRSLVHASAERLRDGQYRSALVRLGYMRSA